MHSHTMMGIKRCSYNTALLLHINNGHCTMVNHFVCFYIMSQQQKLLYHIIWHILCWLEAPSLWVNTSYRLGLLCTPSSAWLVIITIFSHLGGHYEERETIKLWWICTTTYGQASKSSDQHATMVLSRCGHGKLHASITTHVQINHTCLSQIHINLLHHT